MHPFIDPSSTDLIDRVGKVLPPEQYRSVRFMAEVPPARSLDAEEQWRRFSSIIGCGTVYEAFGIWRGPTLVTIPDVPYATDFAVCGVLANLLSCGAVLGDFVDHDEDPLDVARSIVQTISGCGHKGLECYHVRYAWSDWFLGEFCGCDVTFLMGRNSAWWLFAFTDAGY